MGSVFINLFLVLSFAFGLLREGTLILLFGANFVRNGLPLGTDAVCEDIGADVAFAAKWLTYICCWLSAKWIDLMPGIFSFQYAVVTRVAHFWTTSDYSALMFGTLVVFIGLVVMILLLCMMFFWMPWMSLLLCPFLYKAAVYGGYFEVGSRGIRFNQLKLTVSKEEEEQLRVLSEQVMRYSQGGRRFEESIQMNKTLAIRGPKGCGRASPVRAVPALADIAQPGEVFWALENDGVVRYALQGYAEVRIKLLDTQQVSSHLAADLDRWHKLRLRIAQDPACWALARGMHSTRVIFKYPSLDDDGNYKKLQLQIMCPVGQRRGKHSVRERACTVGELEQQYEPLIAEARKSFEARCVRRKVSKTETTASHPNSLEPATIEETGELDDSEYGLCVCCLDDSAKILMRQCGHLVFCVGCARRVVALAKGIANKKDVKARQLESTGVNCPICRHQSYMVRKDTFDGTVYSQ